MLTTCLKTDNLPLTIMGLCPLLLVTTSTLSAVVMGSMFFTAFLLSSLVIATMRHLIPHVLRLPIILLVTACVATLVDLLLSAFYYEWHLILGIYIPLLSMNCLILVNAEEYGLRHGIKQTIAQSLATGLSIWSILLLVGFVRDIMSGLIFSEYNFVIFGMAPGAFLVLGFIIALIKYINIKATDSHLNC
jgi:H+/Na+-translocating ferredoxin:NAD+ oxidoreductase subunit E